MVDFFVKPVTTWSEYLGAIDDLLKKSSSVLPPIFRGQTSDWPLKSSLERACNDLDIRLREALGIEEQLIRDFRRRYSGPDRDHVMKDTLYCLALMQHFGAPTRLTDWTYSPLVAAAFALESPCNEPVVWRLNARWCSKEAKAIAPTRLVNGRSRDTSRGDDTYIPLYMRKPLRAFALPENPFLLNERLIIQKGVFLCPGNISLPLEQNLKAMADWHTEDSIVKIQLRFSAKERQWALLALDDMNVSRATLFPGLDGFARSLWQKLPLYRELARSHIGKRAP